ncbi:tyrosine-type recombinase/integrase [Phytohabitans flavus]|uniref:site-specific integrase n=1 Tax=Phytohabitans flavus TaxID=1076124 RepID=UPI001E445727|nr:site-specific integrase [Phytohabitans flavus]
MDENTRRTYASHLRAHLVPHLGHLKLDRLRPEHIRTMFAIIEATNDFVRAARRSTSPATRASVRGRRGHRPGHLPADPGGAQGGAQRRGRRRPHLHQSRRPGEAPAGPAVGLDGPRVDRWRDTGEIPGPVMVWTPEQTGAFLDHAAAHEPDLYPLLHLIAYRGLRRGEAVGLCDADTHLDLAELAITQQITVSGRVVQRKPPKSETGNRVVALDPATVAVLGSCRTRRPPNRDGGLFFAREDGQAWHPDSVSRRFRQLVADGGLPPVRLHDLRHGAATLALAAGVDLKVIQATLGHSTLALTANTYISVLPQLAQVAAEAVAAIIPRN